MSNLNNEERLKILRARLDEIQQKNFNTENVHKEKEKVIKTSLAKEKNEECKFIIEELTEVVGLNRVSGGYEILTNRGKMSAKRLLIAAGGWTAALFDMLGIKVPVNGAPLQMIVTTPAPKLVNCLMYHASANQQPWEQRPFPKRTTMEHKRTLRSQTKLRFLHR